MHLICNLCSQKALSLLKIERHCKTERAKLCQWRNNRQVPQQKDTNQSKHYHSYHGLIVQHLFGNQFPFLSLQENKDFFT